jgi:hypothetical protein
MIDTRQIFTLFSYRIYSDSLPQDKFHLQALADLFFDRISTLRCLGFIHKPTFFQALDRGTLNEDFGEAVVYIVAALGAKYSLLLPSPLGPASFC